MARRECRLHFPDVFVIRHSLFYIPFSPHSILDDICLFYCILCTRAFQTFQRSVTASIPGYHTKFDLGLGYFSIRG